MRTILNLRDALSGIILRKMLPQAFSIICDDCWGGQIYRQAGIRYLTPTIGLWVDPAGYINFLKNLKNKDTTNLEFIATNQGYPVARNPYSTFFFQHYTSNEEAHHKFIMRYERINWHNLYVKIDFGRPGYKVSDIEEWNSMKLPNSIAFYSADTQLPNSGLFNGIFVPDWVLDGGKMFDISRKYFDVCAWLKNGSISISWTYKMLNLLLLDPTSPGAMVDKLRIRRG